MASENTLKARTVIMKTDLSCLGTKRKCENIKVYKYKQMRSSRQNDKVEQWKVHRAVKDEVQGSILFNNKQKFFFNL